MKFKKAGSSAALARSAGLGLLASDAAGNLSFTPEAYRLWISTIALQNDSGLSNQFYICDTSEADCEVDFANASSVASFEAKLSNIEITPGTYTRVWISCSHNNAGYMKFKGSATLADGTTVYTASAGDNGGIPFTTDSTRAGLVTISGLGGGCGITMRLPKSLTVPEPDEEETESASTETTQTVGIGKTFTITMFSNLNLAAYYTPATSTGMGGCSLDSSAGNGNGKGFCGSYPSVFPYFGDTVPTVEYYRVANSKTDASTLTEDDVNVIVKIIKDSEGTPFWASFGQIYSETTPAYGTGDKGVSGYANSVTQFTVNSDASLTIKSQDYGFSAFKREEHSGEVMGEGILNGAGTGTAVTYHYKAFRYTP